MVSTKRRHCDSDVVVLVLNYNLREFSVNNVTEGSDRR